MFEKAENEIIIIDNFTDRTILDRLKVKNQGVKVFIYTSPITSKITKQDETLFNKQYGPLIVFHKTNIHDRFIIMDGQTLFHVGASIKVAGKKLFAVCELDNSLIEKLLKMFKLERMVTRVSILLVFSQHFPFADSGVPQLLFPKSNRQAKQLKILTFCLG